jgi:hypothetical protein
MVDDIINDIKTLLDIEPLVEDLKTILDIPPLIFDLKTYLEIPTVTQLKTLMNIRHGNQNYPHVHGTIWQWEDGTIDPWIVRTGEGTVQVVNIPQFDDHNGLQLIGTDQAQTQEVFAPHVGKNVQYDLKFYYNLTGDNLSLKFKPFSTGNNFTNDGYFAQMDYNPAGYNGLIFYIKKIKNETVTTLASYNYPGYGVDRTAPHMLSLSKDISGNLKLYFDNTLMCSAVDVENFVYTDMVIQKYTLQNAPLDIQYVASDPLKNENYVYTDWIDKTLDGWYLQEYQIWDYNTPSGIWVRGLMSSPKLSLPFTATTGEWILKFNGGETPLTFYPIYDLNGTGYAIRCTSSNGKIELLLLVNNVETVIDTHYVNMNTGLHTIIFQKDENNNIKLVYDGVVVIKTNDVTINNSSMMRISASPSGYYATMNIFSIQYTPITNAKSSLKTLLEVPYYSDLKTNLCIPALRYDLKTILTIPRGNKSDTLKTLLFINNLFSELTENDLTTNLIIADGAIASDLRTFLMIGVEYEKRIPVIGKILYQPPFTPPPIHGNGTPTQENYPEDYGTPETIQEENGITITIGGHVYV